MWVNNMEEYLILVINPGSTSTKLAIYQQENCLVKENITHSADELKGFTNLMDQLSYRKEKILFWLAQKGYALPQFTAIAARGGGIKPIPSGVYQVNELMLEDLRTCKYLTHASNLGAVLADELSNDLKIPAYIADPVVVDELDDIARISGLQSIERVSIWHALNQKHVARRAARDIGKKYEDCNFIVVHMGGGISIGAHCKGKVIDVNNALNGEGPMSAERSGSIPILALAELCFSGKYTHAEMKKLNAGKGGMVSHLGTNNAKEVEERAEQGDPECKKIMDAMLYQMAKLIGEMSTVLKGEVDRIVYTGGMAYSKVIDKMLDEYVSFIAPSVVYPGEDEMEALALNIYHVLTGEMKSNIYE